MMLKKPNTTQLWTAVWEPPSSKMAQLYGKTMMYIKKACSFYFNLSAMRSHCDDQGLRYSFSSDLVQLRHISGQLNDFFSFQEYFYLHQSHT
jgi:hypothetical protein